ncbi:MAG TPA: type I-C CRISPR-associated endonuclease Cas1 [Tissierellia bacterium]|nr:type I-C CRISPR-associated endonuclease Cas1 [Tissierellia bacterium]
MKKLLNTLYITNPDYYLSLDGLNIVVTEKNNEVGRIPLHNLEGIITFGYAGVSPALMGECAKNGISLSFLSYSGKFLAGIHGTIKGNVILRKEQFKISEDPIRSMRIAKNFIIGKIYNSKWVIERATRDHPLRLDVEKLKRKSQYLTNCLKMIEKINGLDELRGIEGVAASVYFSVFDDLILQQKETFIFSNRNKRPPLDNVNAMLSFAYTLLVSMCSSGLETVGLDPYVGFMHSDRPGRASLALDLMEELRAVYADRFVLTMINKKILNESDFIEKENGSVIMTDDARKTFLKHWQNKKQEVIKHPFLDDKVEWGMVPYVQALLLARYIRDDLDEYPPFLWK